jgi:tetratricopeptide (TPR) repeat protein
MAELTIDLALQKGIEAHKAGQVQEADRLYTAILKAQQKHPDANHNMGVLAIDVGKVQEALSFFKTALEANPSTAQYWLSYIDTLIKVDQLADAQAVLDQAKSKGAKGDAFDQLEQRLKVPDEALTKTVIDGDDVEEDQPNILDTLTLDQAIKLAKKKAKEGSSEDAKRIYQDIRVKFPKNKRASDGLKALAGGRVGKAIQSSVPTIDQQQSLINLYSEGQFQKALEQVSVLLQQFPNSSFLYNISGAVYMGLGQLDASVDAYNKAVAIKPEYAEAYNNMGVALKDHGKLEEAIEAFNKALAIKPDYAEAHSNMGNGLREQGKLEEAIEAYNKAVAIKPEYAEAYNNMGVALKDHGKPEEAIEAYNKALAIKPEYAEAYNNMGVALKDHGKLEEAIEAFNKAVAIKPDYADAHSDMGTSLREQGKLEEAIEAYNKALAIKPDYAEVYNNIGVALKDHGKLEEAIEAYNKALAIKPDYADAHNNTGRLLWLRQEFTKAFEQLEWRWKSTQKNKGTYLKSSKPSWNGKVKNNVFVWREQGIGEEVMFSSILTDLNKKTKKLIIECDKRLIPLYERSFPNSIKFVDDRKKISEQKYDSHIAVGSLPVYFRHELNDFYKGSHGWLKPDPKKTSSLRKKLQNKTTDIIIGISWLTKSSLYNSSQRNISLDLLAKYLVQIPAKYVNLQYGDTTGELSQVHCQNDIQISHIDDIDLYNDLDGLAALISACDLVISIDNFTVHLAGALGVDTRVLLPLMADDRWGLNRSDSYWYDSLNLYRQETQGDWSKPLKNLTHDLVDTLM